MDPLSDATTGLLPHLLQLRTLLNRGQLYEQAVQDAGVTLDRPAMTILVVLDAAEHPLRVGEIATRMHVVGPHVTRHLNSLEKRALIKRVPDPEDQRARLIALTPPGSGSSTGTPPSSTAGSPRRSPSGRTRTAPSSSACSPA